MQGFRRRSARSPTRPAGMVMGASVDSAEADKARRFRDAALPYLDDVYTLARYLLRNPADADDAVQDCYLRAYRHFDGLRGQAAKPWLMAILRNVCRAEFARRSGAAADLADVSEDALPLWQEPENSPETAVLRQRDSASVRALLDALPAPFREAIVLRDVDELSYREIAEVIGAPVGTVMSRLARARSMLREAWLRSDQPSEVKERSL